VLSTRGAAGRGAARASVGASSRVGKMSRTGRVLSTLLIGIAFVATAAFGRSDATAAVPGTWGANAYTYLDGTVCDSADGSSPLASWDFDTGAAAFLVEPVTSSGSTDSAALPFPTAGTQSTSTISPGQFGFNSETDIASYATLVSEKLSTTEVAEVATTLAQLKYR
jgi:hypothetical protein